MTDLTVLTARQAKMVLTEATARMVLMVNPVRLDPLELKASRVEMEDLVKMDAQDKTEIRANAVNKETRVKPERKEVPVKTVSKNSSKSVTSDSTQSDAIDLFSSAITTILD